MITPWFGSSSQVPYVRKRQSRSSRQKKKRVKDKLGLSYIIAVYQKILPVVSKLLKSTLNQPTCTIIHLHTTPWEHFTSPDFMWKSLFCSVGSNVELTKHHRLTSLRTDGQTLDRSQLFQTPQFIQTAHFR